MSIGRVCGIAMVLTMTAVALACGGSSTSPTTVSSIAVTGTAPLVGATSQFSAVATMSNGTTQDVTSLASWSSSNTADATVSSTGLVTGVAAGTVSVQATYGNVSGAADVTVTVGP